MTSTSEAALRLEIARLTGAINRAKTNNGNKGGASFPSSSTFNPSLGFKSTQYPVKQSNTYVNPSYKPISKHQLEVPVQPPVSRIPVASETKDVIIGGVTFESSGRSLVRKDLPKPATPLSKPKTFRSRAPFPHSKYGRGGKASHRPYKPKSTRGRPQRRGNRNMTLNNTLYRSVYRGTFKYLIRRARNRRIQTKRAKLANKPCPRFTTTGACSRGLTCMYQHDPNKIAICWNFLQGTCPNSPETCNLSHDPTPERTPLCMHFANNGRCTRENCPFPHIRVGARKGVCRDFAVLGYCEKGLDCAMQHVRECPDFAEKGECSTKGCKLPHVIRANRSREPAATPALDEETSKASGVVAEASSATATNHPQHPTAEEANLGDEFISLTFHESDSSDGEDEESEEADEEVDDGIVDNYEEGYEPTYD